jgi:hypothetical protein
VLGLDEHFFTRRKGYATTLCDLRHHKIYDVVLGRSEAALEAYLARLEGKAEVRVVSMDLASVYRAIVRKHFPHARIVADRFHVIRLPDWSQLANLSAFRPKLDPVFWRVFTSSRLWQLTCFAHARLFLPSACSLRFVKQEFKAGVVMTVRLPKRPACYRLRAPRAALQ